MNKEFKTHILAKLLKDIVDQAFFSKDFPIKEVDTIFKLLDKTEPDYYYRYPSNFSDNERINEYQKKNMQLHIFPIYRYIFDKINDEISHNISPSVTKDYGINLYKAHAFGCGMFSHHPVFLEKLVKETRSSARKIDISRAIKEKLKF